MKNGLLGGAAVVDEAREHRLAMQRHWKAANPERVRRYRENAWRREQENPEHRQKILQQKRDAEHRRQARTRAAEAHREHERERTREWAAAHPDRVRARQQQWVQRNRERVREQKRAYYYRHLDKRQYANRERNEQRRNDPAQQEKEQAYRAANQARLNAGVKAHRSDPAMRERRNQDQRERRQREKRRRELGLPHLPLHRSTLNERADNAAAADSFFTLPRSRDDLAKIRVERERFRDTVTAEQIIDLQRQIALEARIRAALERPSRLKRAVESYLKSSAGARLNEEVRMDSIARRIRGATPYISLEAEVRRRALARISENHGTPLSSVAAQTSRSHSPANGPDKTPRGTTRTAARTLGGG